jgi:hypothetical protein
MIERLSEERLKKIEKIFLNPPPKSKTAAARDYGVDLSLLFRWLKLSPQERIEEAKQRMIFLEEVKRQGELARKSE